jgi:hypothetical protein
MLLLPVVGLVAALVVGFVLPREEWGAFWTHGVLCLLAAGLMWGFTCSWVVSSLGREPEP